ncbi:unnamed protein product [Arabidopsis halleri]
MASQLQLVWTLVDVVSQRLMAQGSWGLVNASRCKYINAFDAFRKIISAVDQGTVQRIWDIYFDLCPV